MSDEEYEYEYGSEDEGYDYGSDQGDMEGDDEDGGGNVFIEIENSFYEGEDLKIEDPSKAIELLEKVVEMEESQGAAVKWRFKALQHLVTVYFTLSIFDKMVLSYRKMLVLMSSVTRNECTDAINTVLDTLVSATNAQVLTEMYEITLEALKTANNERLWFNTNIKLAKSYLDSAKLSEVERIVEVLKQSCRLADGEDDKTKGAYLLEAYCLEIQLCAIAQDSSRMKEIYQKTIKLDAAVSDPRIMAIIREENGKMFMSEGDWTQAYNELYEAFRNYQEAGNPRARDCLKYVVLASMLSLSKINPFAAREAKVFADDKEIVAMSDLRLSLESNDLPRFERIIGNRQNRILDEPLLMTYIHPLRKRMRQQVLLSITRPYSKVTLSFISKELFITEEEAEKMVVDMILDGELVALIDQTKGHIQLVRGGGGATNTADSQIHGVGDSVSASASGDAKDQGTQALLASWSAVLLAANETYAHKLF